MKNQHSAGFVIFYERDEQRDYLLLHYESGHWDFPKGKLEANETVVQAALRELYEETGLAADIVPDFEREIDYFFKGKHHDLIHKKVTFMIGKTKHKRIVLSYEHIGYCWLPFAQALNKLTYANARQVLTDAHEFLERSIQKGWQSDGSQGPSSDK